MSIDPAAILADTSRPLAERAAAAQALVEADAPVILVDAQILATLSPALAIGAARRAPTWERLLPIAIARWSGPGDMPLTLGLLALGDHEGAARSVVDEICGFAVRPLPGPHLWAAWGRHLVGVTTAIGLAALSSVIRAALVRDPQATVALRKALHHGSFDEAEQAFAARMGGVIAAATAGHIAAGGRAFR